MSVGYVKCPECKGRRGGDCEKCNGTGYLIRRKKNGGV